MARKKNQEERVLERLMQGETLTLVEAFYQMRISQLHTKICVLRKKGYPILGEWDKSLNCNRYWMDPEYLKQSGNQTEDRLAA